MYDCNIPGYIDVYIQLVRIREWCCRSAYKQQFLKLAVVHLKTKDYIPKSIPISLCFQLKWDILEKMFLCKVGENSSSNDIARVHSRIYTPPDCQSHSFCQNIYISPHYSFCPNLKRANTDIPSYKEEFL